MNEKKRTVRAVVFGAGSIGKRHISNFVVNGCTHLTIVEPRSERHGEVEKLLVDLDTGYARPSINFLIDHSSISENPEFDLGIICAPPKWHLELIDMCRERNIPILCEKPLFKDSDDWAAVKQTVNRVDQSGLFNMVAYNYRFCSGLLKFKEILLSGRIGKIVSFRGNF